MISSEDKKVLRELSKEYMEIASLDVHKKKMETWKSFNRGDINRPMVIIDQHPWNELNDKGELETKVQDPYFKSLELNLRKKLYSFKHFAVDMVLEPYITIDRAISGSNYSVTADVEYRGESDTTAKSQHFTSIIDSEEDVLKIKDMDIKEDKEVSKQRFEIAKDVFEGVAPIVQSHGIGFHLGVWDKLSVYMGVEQIYCDLYDRPELLHACMRRITDATIAGIKQANELNAHDDIANTCHGSYIYSDALLPDFAKGLGASSQNCWAFGMAQLFSFVSPAVTAEFEVPYIKELAGYFHSLYYGCCDRLDDRLAEVFKIPKIRKLSCSPWADKENFFKQLEGTDIIISIKPNPALVANSYNEDAIRADIAQNVALSKKYGVNAEMILKDISTVNNTPQRLTRWAEIAKEECEKF